MRMRLMAATMLFALTTTTVLSSASYAQEINISFDFFSVPPVAVAPPPLPIYVVPTPPTEDLVWAPGHWRWDGYDYFWVPGTWVEAPEPGLLWTPGYWAWNQDQFLWREGYWGQHVGYYGGIHYGGGYDGRGFNGGGWDHDHYVPNRTVINVTNITNINNTVSFNGGPGGVKAVETAEQHHFDGEHHIAPTHDQVAHAEAASHNQQLIAGNNHGRPAIAATTKAGDLNVGAVAASSAGARNAQAMAHNEQIRKNPTLAHGAALPRDMSQKEPMPKEVDHNTIPEKPTEKPAAIEQGAHPVGVASSHRHNTPYVPSPESRPAEQPRPATHPVTPPHEQHPQSAAHPEASHTEHSAQPPHEVQEHEEHEADHR